MTNTNHLTNLIFDTNNGVLMSICCNLIYDPTDPFCQKNASNLMEFFNVHDKMDDLFIWAFTKEYLEKRNANDDVETYRFFTAFNYLYAIDNFFEFSKEVVKPLFDDTTLMDSIEIELFKGNPDEFTKEMNERYYKNVQDLLQIMQTLKNGFEVHAKLIPSVYFQMLKGIQQIIKDDKYKERGFGTHLFGKIIKLTVCNFMKNRRMLRRAYQNGEQYQVRCAFIADTLQKLLNKSNEPYIMHLNAIAKNLDDFYSINSMIDQSVAVKKTKNEESCKLAANELAALIKCNILPIKRMLSPMVRIELAVALSLSPCSNDDFSIYTDVLRSFETFTRDYYTYFNAVYSEEGSKTNALKNKKTEYDELYQQLKEKKEKNQKLRDQLIQLRKVKGIPGPLPDSLNPVDNLKSFSDLNAPFIKNVPKSVSPKMEPVGQKSIEPSNEKKEKKGLRGLFSKSKK